MSEIPEEIWHIAEFIVADNSSSEAKAELIARAILAERERCAQFVRAFPRQILQFYDRPGGPPGNGYRPTLPEDIAAALSPPSNGEK